MNGPAPASRPAAGAARARTCASGGRTGPPQGRRSQGRGAAKRRTAVTGCHGAGMLWTPSLLNAACFLPVLWCAWRKPLPAARPDEHIPARGRLETAWLVLVPRFVTASAIQAAGISADTAWSPLAWAQLIAQHEYLQGAPWKSALAGRRGRRLSAPVAVPARLR